MNAPAPPTRPAVVDTGGSPRARLHPVAVTAVTVDDTFWSPLLDRVRMRTVHVSHDRLERTGAISNFRQAKSGSVEGFRGRYYSDSDVYKWVEAAAWTLACTEDGDLRQRLDDTVRAIVSAQDADGYLDTYFTGSRRDQRWLDLSVRHEMYCLGHLVQAAVAHHRTTGRTDLLEVAIRACTLVEKRFPPGTTYGACGHPNLEMALIELCRTTGDLRWLRLAAWQLDSRGRGVLDGSEYLLDHAPVREQTEVTGHAVRALYLYAAMADLVLEQADPELETVADALWEDLTEHKTSVTGGVGARWDVESFGDAYELPDRAYNETCAAIAQIFFAWRMLLRTGHGKYRDVMEHALHNAVLPGVSLAGSEFFYQNPLSDAGRHRRQEWFDCACCPPNVIRLLASLPGYVFTTSDRAVWIHLLIGTTAQLTVSGRTIRLRLESDLPRSGHVRLHLQMPQPTGFELRLPAPPWAKTTTIQVNDEPVPSTRDEGYLVVNRVWQSGDIVSLMYSTPVRLLRGHPRATGSQELVTVTRGPLVYCIEQSDHESVDIRDLRMDGTERWEFGWHPSLPNTLQLTTTANAVRNGGDTSLYREWLDAPDDCVPAQLTAIPYYAWANRAPGAMRVMIPLRRR